MSLFLKKLLMFVSVFVFASTLFTLRSFSVVEPVSAQGCECIGPDHCAGLSEIACANPVNYGCSWNCTCTCAGPSHCIGLTGPECVAPDNYGCAWNCVPPVDTTPSSNVGILNLENSVSYENLTAITPRGLFGSAVNLIFVLAGILSFLMLLYGGYLWIVSAGDKEGLNRARSTILHALIGLVITFSAFVIIRLLSGFTGVNLISPSGSSIPAPTGIRARPTITPIPTIAAQCFPSCTFGGCSCTGTGICECCACVYGNLSGASGPITCCTPPGTSGCRTYNVQGCNPHAPLPPTTPRP
jgi:hypothetical protein